MTRRRSAKRAVAKRMSAERRANPQSDLGTPELKRHHLVVIEGSGRAHGRVVDQRPLDRYLVRGQLSDNREIARALYEAGHRLRTDWTIAGLEPRLIAHMGPRGHGPDDFTERQLAARRRKDQALAAVGPAFVPVLVHVVCCDGTAGEWARGQGKRGGNGEAWGMAALRLALAALARHYRIGAAGRPRGEV